VQPDAKGGVVGDSPEIVVSCQHRQVMTNAQLSQKGIDGSDLYAFPAAPVYQPRRSGTSKGTAEKRSRI
jgi:hypothetical protein